MKKYEDYREVNYDRHYSTLSICFDTINGVCWNSYDSNELGLDSYYDKEEQKWFNEPDWKDVWDGKRESTVQIAVHKTDDNIFEEENNPNDLAEEWLKEKTWEEVSTQILEV